MQQPQKPTSSCNSELYITDGSIIITRAMDRIMEKGTTENWDQAQYRYALDNLLSGCRQDLRAVRKSILDKE